MLKKIKTTHLIRVNLNKFLWLSVMRTEKKRQQRAVRSERSTDSKRNGF